MNRGSKCLNAFHRACAKHFMKLWPRPGAPSSRRCCPGSSRCNRCDSCGDLNTCLETKNVERKSKRWSLLVSPPGRAARTPCRIFCKLGPYCSPMLETHREWQWGLERKDKVDAGRKHIRPRGVGRSARSSFQAQASQRSNIQHPEPKIEVAPKSNSIASRGGDSFSS